MGEVQFQGKETLLDKSHFLSGLKNLQHLAFQNRLFKNQAKIYNVKFDLDFWQSLNTN